MIKIAKIMIKNDNNEKKIEESVLELGLTFCPSQKNFNKEQLTLDFFQFIRWLKLHEFFSKNPTSDNYDNQNMTNPNDERSTLNWINRNSEVIK